MWNRGLSLALGLACIAVWSADAAAGTAVAASYSHTCAVTSGGSVVCWGFNNYGQLGDGTTTARSTPTAVSGLASGVTAVAAGDYHTCALTAAGGVACWGDNYFGQLGDGTTTVRLTPTPVSGLAGGVLALAAGADHTCAVTAAGGVVCWGYNYYGQLGDGTTTDRPSPTAASGLASGVTAVAAGDYHTCAVTAAGVAVCWGYNIAGQLGDGTTTDRPTPTAVNGLVSGVTAVAGGGYHTCAVTSAGGVVCWGRNFNGQLGDGTRTSQSTPTSVSGLASGVTAVAGGGYYTCAVTVAGGVVCWGDNTYGQLGDSTTTQRLTPAPVSGLASGVTSVAAGFSHTCAVTAAGGLACWGSNAAGQLGEGTTTQRLTPTPLSGLAGSVTAVASSDRHSCVINTAGGLLCWGSNTYGQLGDGTTTDRSTPTLVSGLASGATAVAAGGYHTCAVTAGGGVVCWGSNTYGQLGDGTTTDRSTPTMVSGLASGITAVAAGEYHTCAITTAGGVVCWGFNGRGQLGDGTTLQRLTPTPVSGLASGIMAVAAGVLHTCAVNAAGGVVCWGYNTYGQLGDGTTADRLTPTLVSGLSSGATAVEAGGYHTCAVTAAGGVVCWGDNAAGQLGDGTTLQRLTPTPVSGLASGVTAVAGGQLYTCAVTAAGGVVCWGSNSYGQLGNGTTAQWLTPTPVSGLASGVLAAAAGFSHTCAVTAAGGVLCWGDDSGGLLGLGTRVTATTPIGVYGFGGTIAAGSVTPGLGPTSGGTLLTLTGAYLLQGATVTLGGVAAMNVTVVNTELITATTGARAAGTVDVVVRNPDGTTATLAGGFTYEGTAGAPIRGDFTGDLKSDILWRHATGGDVWLWPMDGGEHTAESYVSMVDDAAWEIRGLGDQTGDGQADILWRHATTGQVYLWTMDGSTVEAMTYVGTVDLAFDIVGTGDYDGDGRSDILWRHQTTGELWLWQMNGAETLSVMYVDTVDPAYEVQGSGDLDADGRADLVWQGTAGDVWVWLMNGPEATQVAYVTTVGDVNYRIVGVADYTGDGQADLLWHHATRGEMWLWVMNGAAAASEAYVGTVPDVEYRVVGTGDYDGNGRADILWHHATAGDVWVWLMDGAVKVSEHYIGTVPDTGYQIVTMK